MSFSLAAVAHYHRHIKKQNLQPSPTMIIILVEEGQCRPHALSRTNDIADLRFVVTGEHESVKER